KLVALKRNNTRRLYLAEAVPPNVDNEIDLRRASLPELMMARIDCILFGEGRTLRVQGTPRLGGGDFIEGLIDETPISQDMISFSLRILCVSLMIAVVTSILVFSTLLVIFVRPMQRVTQSMVHCQEKPDDAQRIIEPTKRADEIGQAERVLAAMQTELRQALQ